jgi:hypothetical protein
LYDNKHEYESDSKSKKQELDSELNIGDITQKLEALSKLEGIPDLRNREICRKARDILEKNELIEVIPKGAQLKLVFLTPFGETLIELILRAYEYNDSYEMFLDLFFKRILRGRIIQSSLTFKPDPEEIKENSKLKEKVEKMRLDLISIGWKRNEIDFQPICQTTLVDLKIVCDRNFIDILLNRYSFLISEEKLPKSNKIIEIILKNCITKIVNKKVNLYMAHMNEEYFGYSTQRITFARPFNSLIDINTGGFYQLFVDLSNIFLNGLIPTLIRKEVSDLVYRYLRLLEPLIGNLDYKINDIRKEANCIDSLIKDPAIDPTKKHRFEMIYDTLQTFIVPYERHCKDKNHVIPFLP